MAYLQLADDPYTHLAAGNVKELYLFIPAGFMGAEQDMYVREDKFDSLPENEYQILMAKLAPFQNTGLSGKGSDKRAERRAKRKAEKETKKATKREARQKRVETRSAALSSVLGKASDIVGGILGKTPTVDVESGGLDISYSTEPTFWEKYKTPVIIGGVLLIGGGIYLATRKKSKR